MAGVDDIDNQDEVDYGGVDNLCPQVREERYRIQRDRRAKYSNSPDFINPDPIEIGTILPIRLESHIEEYKKSQSPAAAGHVLRLLSRLIWRMIHQERRRFRMLEHVDLDELYNIAFICLHNAMLKFDVKKSSIYSFPVFFQGYLKHEVRIIIREMSRTMYCGLDVGAAEGAGKYLQEREEDDLVRYKRMARHRVVQDVMDVLIGEGKINPVDLEIFKLRCEMGWEFTEIAAQAGVPGMTAHAAKLKVYRIISKIKKKVEKLKKL